MMQHVVLCHLQRVAIPVPRHGALNNMLDTQARAERDDDIAEQVEAWGGIRAATEYRERARRRFAAARHLAGLVIDRKLLT